jgi:hypothetical protein
LALAAVATLIPLGIQVIQFGWSWRALLIGAILGALLLANLAVYVVQLRKRR